MKEMFIILSHYSNENIGEFDSIGVLPGVYETLEDAKAAADAAFAEDLANGIDHGETVRISDTTGVIPFSPDPVYVTGEEIDGYFTGFHNIYTVFSV